MKIFGTKQSATHYHKKSNKARRLIVILLVLFLAIGGGVYLLLNSVVQPPSVPNFIRPVPSVPGERPIPPPEIIAPTNSNEREIYTLLIAGIDEFNLADTMMLVAVHTVTQEIHVVNIPRDTMIDVSWAGPKINSVIAWTNVYRLMDEIEKITGFLPDNYITVNLPAFERLVDTLAGDRGGIEFNVPIRMVYDDPYANPPLHINFSPGYQLLTGRQALEVMRFRNNNDGTGFPVPDLGRIQTQQAFLHTVARELLQLQSLTRLGALAEIFVEEVNTNLSLGTIAWYAREMYQMDSDNIFFHTMPSEVDVWVRGGSYVLIEMELWLEMVNAYLNPHPMPVTEEHVRLFTRVDGEITLVGDHLPLTPPGSRDNFPQ